MLSAGTTRDIRSRIRCYAEVRHDSAPGPFLVISGTHRPKKDNYWRPCGDYRYLNARTIPHRCPVRHIDDYSLHQAGCTVFSPIDLAVLITRSWYTHTM